MKAGRMPFQRPQITIGARPQRRDLVAIVQHQAAPGQAMRAAPAQPPGRLENAPSAAFLDQRARGSAWSKPTTFDLDRDDPLAADLLAHRLRPHRPLVFEKARFVAKERNEVIFPVLVPRLKADDFPSTLR
jgi:hypothetical protein